MSSRHELARQLTIAQGRAKNEPTAENKQAVYRLEAAYKNAVAQEESGAAVGFFAPLKPKEKQDG